MDYVPLFYNRMIQTTGDVARLLARTPFVVCSTNLSSYLMGVEVKVIVIKELESSSAEHSVFKCRVEFENRYIPNCVVKMKKMNGELHFLSEQHALQMVTNYSTISKCIENSKLENSIRVNNYMLLHAENKFGQRFCLWIEDYLPKFVKFLRSKSDSNLMRRLSLSNKSEIKDLQLWMLGNDYSPIVDPQGYFDEDNNMIILSDIETVKSLSNKFNDINPDSCLRHIESQVSSNCSIC